MSCNRVDVVWHFEQRIDSRRTQAVAATVPRAWLARVQDGEISSWRVFGDNEPIRDIMRKGSGHE
jgi:hypothetical protein